MSDISPIGRSSAAGQAYGGRQASSNAKPAGAQRGDDRVELSQKAQLLNRLAELPDVRHDLVARVRAEIEAGTYETPEKIDKAIDGLIEDLMA